MLLCSDLLHQLGDVEPVTSVDITDRYRHALASYQQSPVLMDYVPYNDNTRRQLANLAALKPRTLAAMHGSTFVGDGAAILLASADVIQSVSGATSASDRLTRMALTAVLEPRYFERLMTTALIGATDGDLARAIAARAGTADAAETELYRRFAPRVRLYGLRHLRDEDAARDLMQQVLLLTIEKLRERRRPRHGHDWILHPRHEPDACGKPEAP